MGTVVTTKLPFLAPIIVVYHDTSDPITVGCVILHMLVSIEFCLQPKMLDINLMGTDYGEILYMHMCYF
jgi:hypothetical protein